MKKLIFLALVCVSACLAQPKGDARRIWGIPICSDAPADTNTLAYDAASKCWKPAVGAASATALAGGAAGQYPYQSAPGVTGFRTPNAANGPVVLDANGNATIAATLLTPVAVADLGTCNAGAKGTQRSVNDANAPVLGSTVAGGGAAYADVSCDGSNWVVMGKTGVGGVEVLADGVSVGTRPAVNFQPGTYTLTTIADDAGNGRVNVTYEVDTAKVATVGLAGASVSGGATVAFGTTMYFFPFGTLSANATENRRSVATPVAMTAVGMSMYIGAAQGASGNFVCTLRRNAGNTPIVVTVPAGSAGPAAFSDSAHTQAYSANDVMSVSCTCNLTSGNCTLDALTVAVR